MNKLDLSISLVTYKNDKDVLTQTVDSVLNSTGVQLRLYIIDNSPTDEIREWYNDERIEYIFNNKNIGFGAAHNIIMRDSSKMGRYHLVLNPDIRFNPEVLRCLINYMDSNPDVGNIIPKTYYPNGKICPTRRLLPRPQDLLLRMFIPFKSWRRNAARRYLMNDCDFNKSMNVPYLSGCFMFLRTKVIEDIGIFDERYFMYAEDIDYNRRIHQKYKTIYYPQLQIVHDGAVEGHHNIHMMKIQITSCIQYFNKWGWFFDKERDTINNEAIRLYFKTK